MIGSHGCEELYKTEKSEQHANKHVQVNSNDIRDSYFAVDDVVHRDKRKEWGEIEIDAGLPHGCGYEVADE